MKRETKRKIDKILLTLERMENRMDNTATFRYEKYGLHSVYGNVWDGILQRLRTKTKQPVKCSKCGCTIATNTLYYKHHVDFKPKEICLVCVMDYFKEEVKTLQIALRYSKIMCKKMKLLDAELIETKLTR